MSSKTDLGEIKPDNTIQRVLTHQRHNPASLYIAPTLTLDSVVKVPLPLHGLLGHDLKQVVGVRDDLSTDYESSVLSLIW